MNKHQKAILVRFITVIAITVIAIVAMINLKDWVNHSEAMRAMEHLGQVVLKYREKNGAVPPRSYIDEIKDQLEGHVRMGNLQYRARWIDFDSTSDEILAYSEKKYRSLLPNRGFIVLRLDGRVQWMDKKEFKPLLAAQQSSLEIQVISQ